MPKTLNKKVSFLKDQKEEIKHEENKKLVESS